MNKVADRFTGVYKGCGKSKSRWKRNFSFAQKLKSCRLTGVAKPVAETTCAAERCRTEERDLPCAISNCAELLPGIWPRFMRSLKRARKFFSCLCQSHPNLAEQTFALTPTLAIVLVKLTVVESLSH